MSSNIRIRIDLAYDGSSFAGWARQPGRRTVQGVLEDALELILRVPVQTVVAGRTDAGVHAAGQVVHADVPGDALTAFQPPASDDGLALPLLTSRLRSALGRETDLVIRSVGIAAPGFDARFSPVWRRYTYRVADSWAIRDPLKRDHVLFWPREVDAEAMDAAAGALVGLHDWAAYCRPRDGATTIRDLQEFTWSRNDDGVLVANVRADAFCHHMVRCLVGATLAVGDGRLSTADLVTIRDTRDRGNRFRMVPGTGLVLAEVGYPPEAELAARADQTRAKRTPLEDA